MERRMKVDMQEATAKDLIWETRSNVYAVKWQGTTLETKYAESEFKYGMLGDTRQQILTVHISRCFALQLVASGGKTKLRGCFIALSPLSISIWLKNYFLHTLSQLLKKTS
jgi:hypothetical protein